MYQTTKTNLEIVFHGTFTNSKAIQNLLASHVNGKINPIHSSTTHAKWLHLMSLSQKMESSSIGGALIKLQWWG
jgi:hypothetical protein